MYVFMVVGIKLNGVMDVCSIYYEDPINEKDLDKMMIFLILVSIHLTSMEMRSVCLRMKSWRSGLRRIKRRTSMVILFVDDAST
jgi:hypothetical protein